MDKTSGVNPRATGRPLIWLGLGTALLGIVIYLIQFNAQRLFAPWYMPILATLGAILVGGSLVPARSVWRYLAFVFAVLLAGAEWALMIGMRLPDYNGPIAVGKSVPAFATVRASGESFTQSDLAGTQNTVLVIFRGRW